MGEAADWAKTERTWEELYVTYSMVKKAWELELAACGLTLPQALVLRCLAKSPVTLTLVDLAQLMCREPHGISALISRMEADGLVRKKRHPKNTSQVTVSLTKKGQDVIRDKLALRVSKDIAGTLSLEELDTLHSICEKMRAEALRLIREARSSPYDAPLD